MEPIHGPAASKSSGDLPPFPSTPGRHHSSLDMFKPQEKFVFTGVVVPARENPFRHHSDNAVHDRAVRPWRKEKNHIADLQRPVAIRYDLHHFRPAQGRIHAGAAIRSEDGRACTIPMNVLRINSRLAHVPSWAMPEVEDYADFFPMRDMGKRPASSACRQNQNGAHNRPSL